MLEPRGTTGRINGQSFMALASGAAAWWAWPEPEAGFYGSAFAYGAALLAATCSIGALGAAFRTWNHGETQRMARKAARDLHPAKWASDADLDAAGMFDPNSGRPLGMTLSGHPIFEPGSSTHSKIVAPPGGWKTIAAIVTAIMHLPHTARRGGRAPSLIVPDVKGELTAMCADALREQGFEVWVLNETGHLDIAGIDLNPYAMLNRLCLSDDPRDRQLVGTYARALSLTEYPEPKDGDEKNRFWRDGSRSCLFAGKLMLAREGDCTPSRLWALLSDPGAFAAALEAEADRDPNDSPAVFAARSLIETFAENAEHFSDFRSTAAQKLEAFERPGMLQHVGEGSSLSHGDVRDRQIAVFMMAPLAYANELSLLHKLHLQSFVLALKQKADGQPVEFVLDEACNANATLKNLIEPTPFSRTRC